ncbi:MAG TPA: tyrosine-type recombinase/integrase [Acidimicrobiia bacterium]|nr:tyrosine-type recombinase/integrase [Acidimicrobiia bacterium]
MVAQVGVGPAVSLPQFARRRMRGAAGRCPWRSVRSWRGDRPQRRGAAPWNPDAVGWSFAREVEATKLPRIRFHDLRHSHATHLLAAGTNVKLVSERLGHATVAFTLDTYGHVLPGQQADAVAALVDA